jgi:hypothetical protein
MEKAFVWSASILVNSVQQFCVIQPKPPPPPPPPTVKKYCQIQLSRLSYASFPVNHRSSIIIPLKETDSQSEV